MGAVVGAFVLAPAAAGAQGFYGEIRGGAAFLPDGDHKGETLRLTTSHRTGFALEGAVGYAFANGFRGELALAYRKNSVQDVRIDNDGGLGVALGAGPLSGITAPAVGDIRASSVMLNGYYDIRTNTRFTPFVGAGVGATRIDADVSVVLNGAQALFVDESDTVFSYQATLGVAYALTERLALSLAYTCFLTTDPEFREVTGGRFESRYGTHTVLAGLRYGF